MAEDTFLEIYGITLLTAGEAYKVPQTIRACKAGWWLQSPSDYDFISIMFVFQNGMISRYGDVIDIERHVRPALIIPELEDLNLEKYKDSVTIFDREWIYIGNGMVLAEKPIFESIFDKNSNNYESSQIKQKLEDWLETQIEKY